MNGCEVDKYVFILRVLIYLGTMIYLAFKSIKNKGLFH